MRVRISKNILMLAAGESLNNPGADSYLFDISPEDLVPDIQKPAADHDLFACTFGGCKKCDPEFQFKRA